MGLMELIFEKYIKKAIKEENEKIAFGMKRKPFVSNKVDFNSAFSNMCFACISVRANPFSKIVNNIVKKQGDVFIDLEDNHWLAELYRNRPNRYLNWMQTKLMISMWLDYYGNAYLYTPVNGRYPDQAWVLPSSMVNVIPGTEDLISHYEIRAGGSLIRYEKNEVCHFKTMAPSTNSWENNFILGQPLLLNAAALAVGADKELMEFVKSSFARDMIPPYILKSPEKMNQEKSNKLKAELKEALEDYAPVATLGGNLDIVQLGGINTSASGINYAQIDDVILLRMARAFGIPFTKLTSKYQNKDTAGITENDFRTDTIDTMVLSYEEYLTDHFRQ